jgi:hypothetical protein
MGILWVNSQKMIKNGYHPHKKMDIIPNGDYGPVILLTKLGCEQQN